MEKLVYTDVREMKDTFLKIVLESKK